MSNHEFLGTLEGVIQERLTAPAESSYTARLVSEGLTRIAQKVGEEGVELALASVAGTREEVRNEAADLIYHLLVLLNAQEMTLKDVCDVLEQRHKA